MALSYLQALIYGQERMITEGHEVGQMQTKEQLTANKMAAKLAVEVEKEIDIQIRNGQLGCGNSNIILAIVQDTSGADATLGRLVASHLSLMLGEIYFPLGWEEVGVKWTWSSWAAAAFQIVLKGLE